ncbi:MFS transporter [Streptomyces sp. NPDC048723]|uniref:MFS transporter n=1 Tax=Streptomyces sp. NPDC048723 TaxID=3365589 RepID=UPI00372253B5
MQALRRFTMLDAPGLTPYLVSRALTMFGATMAPVALAFAVLMSDRPASFLGLVLAAQTAPQLLFILVGGAVGDRAPRKLILVSTNLVMAGCQAGTATLIVLDHVSLVPMMALQALWGTARAFFTPANTGVVPDLVRPERIQDATALVTLSRSVASIGGPAAAGGLLLFCDAGYVVLIDTFLFLGGALLLSRLPLSRPQGRPEESLRESLIGGWREFAGRSWVWANVGGFAFYQGLILPTMFVIGPALAAGEGGMGSTGWAVVLVAQGVGAVLGGLLLMWWRPRLPLAACNLLVGLESLFLFAMAGSSRVEWVALMALIGSIGVTMSDGLWLSTLQREIPDEALSRVSSYEWLGSLAFNPLGMAATGLVLEAASPVTIILTVAVLNLGVRAAVMLSPGVRRIRNVSEEKLPSGDSPGTAGKTPDSTAVTAVTATDTDGSEVGSDVGRSDAAGGAAASSALR